MIGFESTETSFTEGKDGGFISSVLKDTANIDTKQIKKDRDAIDTEPVGAKKQQNANKVVNKDILEPAADTIGKISSSMNKGKMDRRSIIARSRNSIMYFPVYITQTISVNAAQIIAELFERVYASLMQSIISQNPIIDESEANDLLFLKKFHTNINESADIELYNEFYTPIDEVDEMMKESVFYREQITPTMEVTFRAIPFDDAHLMLEHARMQHGHLEGLDYLKEANDTEQQQKKLTDSELAKMVMTDDKGYNNDGRALYAASDDDIRKAVMKKEPSLKGDALDKKVEEGINKRDKLRKRVANDINELKGDINAGKVRGYMVKGNAIYRVSDVAITKSVDAPRLLRDTDIKKINSMQPWMIEASFRIKGSNGGSSKDVHFVLGVKTNLHLIYTQDLAEDLRELVTGNMKSLQKVRYKTGEITFADYMFNKKGIKADAAKSINYNKRWLNTLKRLGEWEKLNGSLLDAPAKFINSGKDIPIPNGTLVLAQTDVTTMTEQTGIDLSIVSNAKRLARSLFLIAICIVDSSAGTMRVLFPDNSSEWDVQSLASIDAELSKADNSQLLRELNRAINR